MAVAFQAADRASPFHYKGGVAGPNYLQKELKELLKAFENQDFGQTGKRLLLNEQKLVYLVVMTLFML